MRSINSTTIKRRPRGTAEIELMLAMTVLIAIVLLSLGILHLGGARLSMSQTAAFQAFHDATEAGTPKYADVASWPPVTGFSTVRPGLPNRLHLPHPQQSVAFSDLGNVNVGSTAAVLAPTWTQSGYPVGSDTTALDKWYTDYVDESHASLNYPLGLSPAWPP